MDINPYESPKSANSPPAAANRSTFGGVTIAFTVHTSEPHGVETHRVEIYFSRWTGLEVFRIDGVQRLRTRSFAFSSVRRLDIEGATPHVLEIATKAFPWPGGRVSLDGQTIIDDLFPSERRLALTLYVILLFLLTTVAALLVYAGLRLGLIPPR